MQLAELSALDCLPPSVNVPNERELRKLDGYYLATLTTKRKRADAKRNDKMQEKVLEMHKEFGLPDQSTMDSLKERLMASIWHQLNSKQLVLENLNANARKISGEK